jgi:hypothetical protein
MPAIRSYLNPFSVQEAELRTRLSPEECVERLKPLLLPWYKRGTISGPFFSVSLAKPDHLAGVASREGFRVRLAVPEGLPRGGSNSFQTEAVGRFIPTPEGTRIPIRFGLIRWLALAYWPLVAVLSVICTAAGAWMGSIFGLAYAIVVATIMLLCVPAGTIGVLWWGRHLARGEADSLIALLCAALEAREAAQTEPAGSVATAPAATPNRRAGDAVRRD